jgi:hypothetical protein
LGCEETAMQRWRVIIEGEAAAKHFIRTVVVGAANADEAGKIARVELEKDGDRFVDVAEVSCEGTDVVPGGLLSISGRIFFDD